MIKILKINVIVMAVIVGIYLLISLIAGMDINIDALFSLMHVIVVLLNIILLPVYIIKMLSATKKIVNVQYIDSKESIYTRDLPKEYNSVIAGELLDLKSRIKDEYVAGIIELISKGYIIEEQDSLVVDNKKATDKLLKNEKYILETINNFDAFFNIDYQFFKKVREDMLDLGLYKKKNYFEKIIYYMKRNKDNKSSEVVRPFIFFIIFMVVGYLIFFEFKIMFFMSIIIYIISVIFIRKNKLTEKGEREKEKIGKLKLFFDKETNFKDKTKEERKLWGRYSAFAVALGVNEEIKKDIYEKILKCNTK